MKEGVAVPPGVFDILFNCLLWTKLSAVFCIGDGGDHSFINKDTKLGKLISFKGQWLLRVHAVCVHAFFHDVPFWFVCNQFQSWVDYSC